MSSRRFASAKQARCRLDQLTAFISTRLNSVTKPVTLTKIWETTKVQDNTITKVDTLTSVWVSTATELKTATEVKKETATATVVRPPAFNTLKPFVQSLTCPRPLSVAD